MSDKKPSAKTNNITNVAIVIRPSTDSTLNNTIINCSDWLRRRKKHILFLEKEKTRIEKIFKGLPKHIQFSTEEKIHKSSDLIISLGGDGTLIGIGRHAKRSSPPIFGVNMGTLGFITEFSKQEFFDALGSTLKGQFIIERRYLYKVEIIQNKKTIFKEHFLNDVVINQKQISRMFKVDVECDKEHMYELSGDGLIISSPVGSTAYSLAAGGPIVHPKVNGIVLTPICPHGLTHRPLVIPDTSTIELKVPGKEEEIILTLDGQSVFKLGQSQTIRITKNRNRYINLIKNTDRTYFHTLKEKFTYGRRSRT